MRENRERDMSSTEKIGKVSYIVNFLFLVLVVWLAIKPADQSGYVRGLILGTIGSLCPLQSSEMKAINRSTVESIFTQNRQAFDDILREDGKTIRDVDSNGVFASATKKWPDCPTSILLK
jgi:hypothetical protein